MKNLTIRQARQSLPHLDDVLEAEGEITITKRGKAVARVVQLGKSRPIPSHKDLRDKMMRLKSGSEKLIRKDRDAR